MRVSFEAALLAVTWLIGWLLCCLPSLPAASRAARVRVSVIVPARNEATRLPSLLAGLARQWRPADEVFVVDDASTDDTAAVATAGGAPVIAAPPLPDGWTGKTWACWTGAEHATGEVLVFLDADTQPEPDLVAHLVEAVERGGDHPGLVSVMPYHRMERQHERLSAFFSVISVLGTRRDYDVVNGHRSVRAAVVHDVGLAQRFRAELLPVRIFGGRGVIRFRLCGGGLRDLVEGWSKNFASGAASTPLARFLLVFAWLVGVGTAAQAPVREAVAAVTGWSGPGIVLWVGYAAFIATQRNVVIALIDAGVWATWSALSGYAAHRVSQARLAHDNRLFRIRPFERDGRFYEQWIRFKRWKDRLPDAGDVFAGGVSKRALISCDREHLERFAAETRRAELAHWLILAAAPWFFLWNPWWLGLAMVGYGIVANMPCIAIQRYNRARLLRMIRRPSAARTA